MPGQIKGFPSATRVFRLRPQAAAPAFRSVPPGLPGSRQNLSPSSRHPAHTCQPRPGRAPFPSSKNVGGAGGGGKRCGFPAGLVARLCAPAQKGRRRKRRLRLEAGGPGLRRSLPGGHATEMEAAEAPADPEERVARERQRQCAEFAAITGRECGWAQWYLAENDWRMERALNSYFESAGDEGAPDARPRTPAPAAGVCVDLTKEPTNNVNSICVDIENCGQKEDDSTFSLITWNIDGLDIHNLQDRARGVCEYLALYTPDVVFLQEVIPPYYNYLKKRATSYTIISGNEDGYFTVVMLKKSRVKLISHEIVPFPTTQMMRNLLCVHVTICGNELCLLNSHFESTRNHARERMNQLKMVLKKMQEVPESITVIFGGDTNLRDHEVSKSGGLPEKILDVWEFLGKPEHCRYTWDTQANTNLAIEATCKLRFDRIFFRPAADGCNIVPRSLDLIGLEKLDCGRFPSDHWGLLCGFDVIL